MFLLSPENAAQTACLDSPDSTVCCCRVFQREIILARTGGPYIDYLPGKVRDGSMAESVLDLALRHTVGLRFRLGLFVSLCRLDSFVGPAGI